MSGHGVHVHAAHDHELEHAAHGGDKLAQFISIFTALLATFGAIVGFYVANTLNESMRLKNEAVLKKAEASDQWNYYQAKSQKGNLAQIAGDLTGGEKAARYKKEVERYNEEKAQIKDKAEALEKKSEESNEKSAHLQHPLHYAELAMAFLQIAIALASVTALTKKKWLFGVAGVAAAAGVVLTALAWIS
jgi:succinate dehydrogenase/fumarate reductase flavoprotein subunit